MPNFSDQPVWWAIVAATIATILVFERKPSTFAIALIDLFGLYAVLRLLIGLPIPAAIATFGIAATLAGASRAKLHYDGCNLLWGDLRYQLVPHIPILMREYRSAILPGLVGLGVAIAVAAALVLLSHEAPLPIGDRLEFAAIAVPAMILANLFATRTSRFHHNVFTSNRAHFSAFVASLIGSGPNVRWRMEDIGPEPLPLAAPCGAEHTGRRPDIIVVLQESTFDPGFFGLPVGALERTFLSPPSALSGPLHVDVFGGGTWQSEFSIYSGLSSLSFGDNARFVVPLLAERLHHTLPAYLAGLGYGTVKLSSDTEVKSGADRFYRGIGFAERHYPARLEPPFNLALWQRERPDGEILGAALRRLECQHADAPLFLSVMTLMNHAGHTKPLFTDNRHPEVRSAALAASGNAEFAEYAVRLHESALAYAAFRDRLAATGRPVVLLRYGDHQPTLTRRLVRPGDPADILQRTFFAIEAINCEAPALDLPAPIDIAFLGTVALATARLPLDDVLRTRLALLDEAGSDYFASDSTKKRAFHRTLVERGLIEL